MEEKLSKYHPKSNEREQITTEKTESKLSPLEFQENLLTEKLVLVYRKLS